ncbi:unnamed protein product, partial [Aureobasidium mustum]
MTVDGRSSTDTALTTRLEVQQSDRVQRGEKWTPTPSLVTAAKPNSQGMSQSRTYYSFPAHVRPRPA